MSDTDQMTIVLLADDTDDVRRIKQSIRESQLSASVIHCSKGAEALDELEEREPDVVLVRHTPDSGKAEAFVNEARARGHAVPLVILSTDLDEDLIREALRLDVADVRDLHHLSPGAIEASVNHAIGHGKAGNGSGPDRRTDPKTGLLNHDTILHRLRGVLKQSTRHDFVSSIALLDVDDLDRINDRFGSGAGDRILRDIADIVQDAIRESDFAGGYSGDRILVICPHTKLHGTYALGNRINDRIEEEVAGPEDASSVTVSMGCISFDGAKQASVEQQDLDDLMERAESTVGGAQDRDECTVVGTLHQRMENR